MKNDTPFTRVTDEAGLDYYCPLTADDRDAAPDTIGDDCVESDVVHRYSGHIHVV